MFGSIWLPTNIIVPFKTAAVTDVQTGMDAGGVAESGKAQGKKTPLEINML